LAELNHFLHHKGNTNASQSNTERNRPGQSREIESPVLTQRLSSRTANRPSKQGRELKNPAHRKISKTQARTQIEQTTSNVNPRKPNTQF
jgi:hypothetical protein